MKRLIRTLAVAVVGLLLMPITSVFAVANPDSMTLPRVGVFTNVSETGDQIIFARYNISYATPPTETADTTFLMAVYDTDGTTLLYTRMLNNYGHDVISVYLTAAQAITVGGAYVVRITGNPGIFDPLIENTNMVTWTLTGGDFQEGDLLGDFLLGQAAILEASIGTDLLADSGRLNTAGATIFKDGIPGIDTMIPSIFETATIGLTLPDNAFNNSYGNVAASRIGTMNTAFADIGAWLGISGIWASVMVSSVGAFILAGILFAATKKPEIGVIGAAMSTLGFAWIGWIPLQALFIGVLFIVIIFGIVFILGRMQ